MFVCEIDQLYNLALFEYIISVSIIDSTIINRSIVCSEKQENPKLINFYQIVYCYSEHHDHHHHELHFFQTK